MINIGICDDDKRCRDILKQQIINTINEKEVYFTEFSNADSMIKRKDDLDVVFLDMELPDMDGETAARQVEKEKVVIVSGYPEVFYGDWEEYASAYLEKPVNLRELKKITDRAAMLKESKKMAIDRVKEYLKKYNMDDKVMEFDVSSATVSLAAEALHCEPGRIAKTMSFILKDGCIVVVTAGDAKIDNKKFKTVFSQKAKMVPAEDVETLTGHPVGGVCPFSLKEGVKVYLDESLKRFETVYPACGSPNSAIELTIDELTEISGAENFVDVCKL